ncbi:hypothetical protein HR11_02125 [Porphyromonas macacae]|nr:hypothetical protein HR11_02125 [Porphyromonas macacae]
MLFLHTHMVFSDPKCRTAEQHSPYANTAFLATFGFGHGLQQYAPLSFILGTLYFTHSDQLKGALSKFVFDKAPNINTNTQAFSPVRISYPAIS